MKKFLFYLEALDEAVHFMESEDRQDLLPAFVRAAVSKDRFRGENLFDLVPEFAVLRDRIPLPASPSMDSSPAHPGL